jgi:transcription antitermination factor NusG
LTDTHQQFPWYALKVRSRREFLVRTALERKSFPIFLPTYQETRQYSDRIKKVDAPLFPGYVFCRLDVNHWHPVVTTPGVDYILSCDGRPQPVPDAEIDSIARVLRAKAAVGPWPFLKTGTRVRIERGAFAGIQGVLVRERGTDRLVLSIAMLQRAVAVEIDRDWIRPL